MRGAGSSGIDQEHPDIRGDEEMYAFIIRDKSSRTKVSTKGVSTKRSHIPPAGRPFHAVVSKGNSQKSPE